MSNRALILFLSLSVSAIVACGGSSSSGSGSGSSGGTGGTPSAPSGQGTVNAVIDGVAYSGRVASAIRSNNTLTISSFNANNTVSLNLGAVAAVGTTTIGAPSSTQFNVLTLSGGQTTGSWFASATQGSGQLTISSLTSTGVSGTFEFQALPAPAGTGAGATGTKVVTSGSFTATF